jgi:DNA-3-methyladenine glycosylase II
VERGNGCSQAPIPSFADKIGHLPIIWYPESATMKSAAVEYLKANDRVLKGLIKKFGPLEIEPRRIVPFHSLIHAIAHQQLTAKAANTILTRFKALFGNGAFPTAEQILAMELATISSAGFSKAKASFVQGIARRQLDGFIPTLVQCKKMTDAEIVALLTEIKGVGRWTAEMFLMFNLGRPDVLPIHDFGVRRGFQIAYKKRKLPALEQLESPYRTTAALYLYRAADFLEDGEW